MNAEPPSEKAEDQRSLTSRENKDSSSKQDHTNVKDEERHSEEDEPHREESSGKEMTMKSGKARAATLRWT